MKSTCEFCCKPIHTDDKNVMGFYHFDKGQQFYFHIDCGSQFVKFFMGELHGRAIQKNNPNAEHHLCFGDS